VLELTSMKVLGIESSCDETAAAVAEDDHILLSNVVASSMAEHIKYGGVVPEIAARSHIEVVISVVDEALKQAGCNWEDIDAIACTYGAGLSGSLLVGLLTARTLAICYKKPFYAINHVEAHVYANFLTDTPLPGFTLPNVAPVFPMLAVIVSGGHSQLALFEDHFKYKLLGQTQDDAIGEAFDKVAKIIGLPYPGGPSVSKSALNGDPKKIKLPIPKMSNYDFSFSGLKTAVLRATQAMVNQDYTFPSVKLPELLDDQQRADIAASFEATAVKTITSKVERALDEFSPASLVLAGGVAANQTLRSELAKLSDNFYCPDLKLCTDNGAMVAALGSYKHSLKQPTQDPFVTDISPGLSM
jgi:N6-L-threonylcarbamoyladenine synthase